MTRATSSSTARLSITKVALDPSVNATDGVAFDIKLTNAGLGAALNLAINDPLPTTAGTTWTIDAANSDAGWTIEGGALKFSSAALCTRQRQGPDRERHDRGQLRRHRQHGNGDLRRRPDQRERHHRRLVPGRRPRPRPPTTARSSRARPPRSRSRSRTRATARPTASRSRTRSRPASTGPIDNDACTSSAGILTCAVGDLDPAGRAVRGPVLSGPTDAADCAGLPNRATATATNEPDDLLENNTDGDDIVVQCASIDLVKTAGNAADGTILTIPVPGSVTFTYVVTNTGTADLVDIALVDDNATPANTADDVTSSARRPPSRPATR